LTQALSSGKQLLAKGALQSDQMNHNFKSLNLAAVPPPELLELPQPSNFAFTGPAYRASGLKTPTSFGF
jgi:hypothetical protein